MLQVLAWTQEGNDVRLGDWSAREIEILNSWQLLTAKPVVYLVNMSAKVCGVLLLSFAMVQCTLSQPRAVLRAVACTANQSLSCDRPLSTDSIR